MHVSEFPLIRGDGNAFRGLDRYRRILEWKEKARFRLAKENGRLPEKAAKARRILKKCELCERKCGIDRTAGEKGFCGVGDRPRVFGAHAHFGEEPDLVPSATIFFSGCTMKCVYCQNAPESMDYEAGAPWTAARMAEWIDDMAGKGCRNVNFVGGDPTPNLPWILEALGMVESNIPVVWNSNSYYSRKTAELLEGIVDVYLLDFRYFDERCSRRLSSAPDYPSVAKRNFLQAEKDAELLIRVLVIPNHLDCDAKPIVGWIGEKIGPDVRMNILAQYRPCWRAGEFGGLEEPLAHEDYSRVVAFARKIGMQNLV
jgi:putative pyruvate formate lyase activating enzyme